MESVEKILVSANGVTILLLLGKAGYFSFKNKNITIGRTEGEVRAVILKQKEFLLQYCSYLTLVLVNDLTKFGVDDVSYVNTDYVVEKDPVGKIVSHQLLDAVLNHVTDDEAYVKLKIQQSRLIMLKAIGRVNPLLLQKEELVHYFDSICEKTTKEIIKGVLGVYNLEKKGN